jgi:hypothetical protein
MLIWRFQVGASPNRRLLAPRSLLLQKYVYEDFRSDLSLQNSCWFTKFCKTASLTLAYVTGYHHFDNLKGQLRHNFACEPATDQRQLLEGHEPPMLRRSFTLRKRRTQCCLRFCFTNRRSHHRVSMLPDPPYRFFDFAALFFGECLSWLFKWDSLILSSLVSVLLEE